MNVVVPAAAGSGTNYQQGTVFVIDKGGTLELQVRLGSNNCRDPWARLGSKSFTA